MSVTRILLTTSFVAGLIPTVVLLILYGMRTAWSATVAGRAMFYLVAVMASSYFLSVLALIWPEIFLAGGGQWFRIGARLAIAAVLWNLLFLFFRAQGVGKRRSEQIPNKEQERYEK